MASTVSAHDLLVTRLCIQRGCGSEAAPGSEYCGEHPRPGRLKLGEVTSERLELARRVRALRDQGKLHNEIAQVLGISRSYSSELALDPDGSKARTRKDGYRQPCPKCGRLMTGSDGMSGTPDQCHACQAAELHDERHWNAERIVAVFQAFERTFGRPPVACDTGMGLSPSQSHRLSQERLDEIAATSTFGLPVPGTVMREFGSWNAGIRAAGFTPNVGGAPGHRGRRLSAVQQETLALLADGLGGRSEIASVRGVRTNAVDNTLTRLCELGLAVKVGLGRYELADGATAPRQGGRVMARMFVVLERNGIGWIPRETVDALTAELAIEKVAAGEGEYVAVEERHWQPCNVAPVTRLTVVREPQPA